MTPQKTAGTDLASIALVAELPVRQCGGRHEMLDLVNQQWRLPRSVNSHHNG
ncbi:hypothetical protein [Zymobacter sp. IVIA_12111.31 C1]|uniref:hypothetical protein n=1 Tax=Zymobacter sp. IVIA_12111.31 C1 TaxID=3394854 RepID=UPI0039C3E96A